MLLLHGIYTSGQIFIFILPIAVEMNVKDLGNYLECIEYYITVLCAPW